MPEADGCLSPLWGHSWCAAQPRPPCAPHLPGVLLTRSAAGGMEMSGHVGVSVLRTMVEEGWCYWEVCAG